MLKPHELARAMSFGDNYQFAGNQGEQVKQIGNAWPCCLGQALIQSLIQDYSVGRKPRRLEAIA
jgi:site-specific DNA-cytosine methylase